MRKRGSRWEQSERGKKKFLVKSKGRVRNIKRDRSERFVASHVKVLHYLLLLHKSLYIYKHRYKCRTRTSCSAVRVRVECVWVKTYFSRSQHVMYSRFLARAPIRYTLRNFWLRTKVKKLSFSFRVESFKCGSIGTKESVRGRRHCTK